jgi:hypothetical protein
MRTMDELAISNLRILNTLPNELSLFNLVIDGKELSISEDEKYDKIFDLKELEFPIYFSFQQLLNSLRFTSFQKIDGYKTSTLIKMINQSIDKVYQIIEMMEDDENSANLQEIIDDIDDKYVILKNRYSTCSFGKIFEAFNDHLDSACGYLAQSKEYLYFPVTFSVTDDVDVEEVNEEVNEETEETNPNLQYDDDIKLD